MTIILTKSRCNKPKQTKRQRHKTIRSSNTIFHEQQMSSRKLLNLVLVFAKKVPSFPQYQTSSPTLFLSTSPYVYLYIGYTEWSNNFGQFIFKSMKKISKILFLNNKNLYNCITNILNLRIFFNFHQNFNQNIE